MNKVTTNLRQLVRAHPTSENELSRNTGVPQPTIHRILAGRVADPRDGTLRPLATWFGVTVEQLRTSLPGADGGSQDPVIYPIRTAKGLALGEPVHDIAISEVRARTTCTAGRPRAELVATGQRRSYPTHWFTQRDAAPADVRLMRVHGDGMERTLFDGDLVAVMLGADGIVDGRVHVFASGGGSEPDVKIKRLFKTSDGRLRVVSDNPDKALYPDELLSPEDMANVLVIGRAIDRCGRGGL